MAVTEDRVKELIAEAVADPGPVYAAIAAKIAVESAPSGVISTAIAAAAQGVATGVVQNALQAAVQDGGVVLKAIRADFEDRADAEYPYRAKLRSLSPTEYAQTWKRLVVDPDTLSSMQEALNDSGGSMATILALGAAHPDNIELAALKQQAAMRHAPRMSWKSLCLPSHGGSSDRLQVFLGERAEAPDAPVNALARSLLTMYHFIQKRFTVHQAIKKNGPKKAEEQREMMMELVYEAIKAYKRRTTKATAAVPMDTALLLHDFGSDLLMAEAAMHLKRDSSTKRSSAGGAVDGPVEQPKRPRLSAESAATNAHGVPAPPPPHVVQSAKQQTKAALAALKEELATFCPGKSQPQLQQWIDDKFAGDDATKKAIGKLLHEICRNCLYAGKGVQEHTMKECKKMGNKCVIACTRCTGAGRTGNVWHWAADCPY